MTLTVTSPASKNRSPTTTMQDPTTFLEPSTQQTTAEASDLATDPTRAAMAVVETPTCNPLSHLVRRADKEAAVQAEETILVAVDHQDKLLEAKTEGLLGSAVVAANPTPKCHQLMEQILATDHQLLSDRQLLSDHPTTDSLDHPTIDQLAQASDHQEASDNPQMRGQQPLDQPQTTDHPATLVQASDQQEALDNPPMRGQQPLDQPQTIDQVDSMSTTGPLDLDQQLTTTTIGPQALDSGLDQGPLDLIQDHLN